jgi:hypothetical protein
MQALDRFPHDSFTKDPLYSSIPYITGHNSAKAIENSIIWMSSSESWVDIYEDEYIDNGSYVNFLTETGRMEIFIFASTSPK